MTRRETLGLILWLLLLAGGGVWVRFAEPSGNWIVLISALALISSMLYGASWLLQRELALPGLPAWLLLVATLVCAIVTINCLSQLYVV
jgi:drug/metabolite transporter (DMT)-like permease